MMNKKIIKGIIEKDEAAFEQLFEKYNKILFYYSLKYTHNVEDAEDAVQEIFIKVLDHIHTYDEKKASFETWLFTIANNHLKDIMKVKESRRNVLATNNQHVESAHCVSNQDDLIMLSEVERYIGEEAYRILYMKDGLRMKFSDIAEESHMTISKVKHIYYNSHGKVKKFIRGGTEK